MITGSRARTAPVIAPEDFDRFRDYFYRETGITFDRSKRYFVDKRLAERICATKVADFEEYYMLLRFQNSRKEFQELANAMTVNETYFLREDYQFRCLAESILPDITSRKQRGERLRIWCLPCSTGEEPYSIAIHLSERWAGLADWDVEIIGSDIDTNALARARLGRFSKRSLHAVPAEWRARYFQPYGEDFQIIEDLRQSVSFTRVNAASPAEMQAYRDIDVIFCRNMLIYFDDASRRASAEACFEALRPGGYICLGHSESMSRISPLFNVRKFPTAIVYQKPMELS